MHAERKFGLKKESNEEKTTARYVSWFVYFTINTKKVPERHFALPWWHRSYTRFWTLMCGYAKRQDASEKAQGEKDDGFD
jgi:hypothetical protein